MQAPSQTSQSQKVPIPLGSRECPICKITFANHYSAALHYKVKHLHTTKWQCPHCHKFLTSQANLDQHVTTVHVQKKFVCTLCPGKQHFESEQELKDHMVTHSRYRAALREGKVCPYSHQKYMDLKGHKKSCKHRPDYTMQTRFICDY